MRNIFSIIWDASKMRHVLGVFAKIKVYHFETKC